MATIIATPIVITMSQLGSSSVGTVSAGTGEDQTFKCDAYDRYGDPDKGVITITLSQEGELLENVVEADPIEIILTQHGSGIYGQLVTNDPITVNISVRVTNAFAENIRNNWVKWSKIGAYDFTIDQSNVAGERPMDWDGYVWRLLKLDDKVIAYGQNGISVLSPKGVAYGLKNLLTVGIASKHAATGTENIHWFIDVNYHLWELSDKLTKLDYSNALSVLVEPHLFYSNKDQLLYICDGTYGFVFNTATRSLTKGPETITGVGQRGSTNYVTASETPTVDAWDMLTDTIDFGTRKMKTVTNIECHTTFSKQLSVRIYYREFHTQSYSVSPWFNFTPVGIAFCPCQGVDFQFEFKAASYEASITVDQIKINGIIHGFSLLDAVNR